MKILPSSPDFWLTLQNGKCWQCWTHTAVWQPVTSADQRPRPFCGTWALPVAPPPPLPSAPCAAVGV